MSNEVNILAPEYMITEEEAITNMMLYQNSKLSFMNPNLRSEEAYFGENNPVKIGLTNDIKLIRETYERITDTNLSGTERKKHAAEMDSVCKKVSRDMASWFNIEKCYLGIFKDLNAFAYPLIYDSNLVTNKKGQKSVNETFRKSLEDIVETKNGFKFKDPKQKTFVIGLGCGFFDAGYSDEEVAAVILHEVGHCFQHMLLGVNANLAQYTIQGHLQSIHVMLEPIVSVLLLGTNWIVALMEGAELSRAKNSHEEDIAEEVIKQMNDEDYSRDKWGKEIEATTNKEMKDASKTKKQSKFLAVLAYIIFGTLIGIVQASLYIIAPIWYFINPLSWPQRFFELGNLKFFRQMKRYEQFADMFATNYGLGKQLASALSKMGKEYHKINLYTLNWLNYVPVLNVAINVGHYSVASVSGLVDEHPETKDRIVAIYKTCVYEIKNNPDLTAKEKAELQAHIDELHKVYEDYVLSLDSRNFVYGLWKRILKSSLEKEKSTVEENVLSELKNHSEANKLKHAKNPKEKEREVNMAIAALDNSGGIKSKLINAMSKLKGSNGFFAKRINRFESFLKSF